MYAKLQVNVRYTDENEDLVAALNAVAEAVSYGDTRGALLVGGGSVEWDMLVDPDA
jgi:hypothetical protein